MDALDGNAIAGPLFSVFGREMTTVRGTCATCRTETEIAELVVFARGPGTVVRCPACGGVVMVLVEVRGLTQAYLIGIELNDPDQPG